VLAAISAGGLVLFGAVAPVAAVDGGPTVLHASVGGGITLPQGDGFRDEAALTVTSDAAITAAAAVLLGESIVNAALPSLALTDPDLDGVFSGTIALSELGLAAGEYSVAVTEAAGDGLQATAGLTIGSGHAVDVTLTSKDMLFPFVDGNLDTLEATVQAFDETGTALPFNGQVALTSGEVSRQAAIASPTGAAALTDISATDLPLGTGSLVATVHGPTDPAATASKPIALLATKLGAVGLSKDVSTVYPAADGYRDTVAFSYTATTAGPEYLKATGKVAVSLNGRTVKAWDVISSKARTFTWNGLNGGRIVPGKYTVTVSAKGPQASAKTATIYVNVSAKRLVMKTITQTWDAPSVVDGFDAYGAREGDCSLSKPGVISCDGYDVDDSGNSVRALGSVIVPEPVADAYSASVRVTANTDAVAGDVFWGYGYDDAVGASGRMRRINSTLDWLRLQPDLDLVYVDFWLGKNSSADVDWFRVEYRFKVLV
jgi:hypothetical protein